MSGYLEGPFDASPPLLIYDRQTETLWRHGTGLAILGELAGSQLTVISMRTMTWQNFKATYATGGRDPLVLLP